LLAAVCVISAFAHETATPTGKWEWADVGMNGKTPGTCELAVKDGVVTGTLTAMGTPGEITPGTFQGWYRCVRRGALAPRSIPA